MGIQASMIYRPVVTDAHIEHALRIAQTKPKNTGEYVRYQSKAVRLVNYKVRQNREVATGEGGSVGTFRNGVDVRDEVLNI